MNPALKDIPPILLLDYDASSLALLQEQLTWEGYNVVEATTTEEALEHLAQKTFSVIISDQPMEGMIGLDFFRQAKVIRPNAVRVLITETLSPEIAVGAINDGEIFRFLKKPWHRAELLAAVSHSVQRYQSLETHHTQHLDTAHLNRKLEGTNADLQAKVNELIASRNDLNKAHQALETNFDHSLELCYRIISTFYPLLGKNTKAAVDICKNLSETKYFTEEERHVLVVSAWLHDIGLIGCERELLHKLYTRPDLLTKAEQAIIHNHPLYGQTLASFVDQLTAVGETIRAHHERFDGRGYPDGLAGETIPWTARCLAVVVYFVECGLSKSAAVESILAESGKAFDPEAVRLFFKVTQIAELPRKIKEIMTDELEPGMILAKGIYNPSGLLLVPEGQKLTPTSIARIKNYNLQVSVTDRLLVYS